MEAVFRNKGFIKNEHTTKNDRARDADNDGESFDADDFDPFDKSDLWITDDDGFSILTFIIISDAQVTSIRTSKASASNIK